MFDNIDNMAWVEREIERSARALYHVTFLVNVDASKRVAELAA
jgi:hypothetical protein